eukprot:TRINITY_DN3410_c0_g1_i1.p1 TRINITY_DN3410_c0_g1~~TRINITY_DN3410_c0_g1_i1.p1  ORF type:complete len:427 (+),score=36.50 TRINITY_DN3410_c0_g1_i1:41-1321(+)
MRTRIILFIVLLFATGSILSSWSDVALRWVKGRRGLDCPVSVGVGDAVNENARWVAVTLPDTTPHSARALFHEASQTLTELKRHLKKSAYVALKQNEKHLPRNISLPLRNAAACSETGFIPFNKEHPCGNSAFWTPRKESCNRTGTAPRCVTLADVYPGRLIHNMWVPDNCELTRFSESSLVSCVKSRPFLGIGDSIVGRIADHLRDSSRNRSSSPHVKALWTPATTWPAITSTPTVDLLPYLQNSAGFILISHGMWDMGMLFCGTDNFYRRLKEKVVSYTSLVKQPDSRIVLLDIPYIHRNYSKWARGCNPVEKIVAYREMIHQVASCLRIGVFDMFDVQKQATSNTVDGVHITGDAMWAAGEVLLNVMCDGVDPYYPSLPCTPEHEEALLKRLRSDPIANAWSTRCQRGGPNEHHCFDSTALDA